MRILRQPSFHIEAMIEAAERLPDEECVTALLKIVSLYSPVILRLHEILEDAEETADRIQQPARRLRTMETLLRTMEVTGYSRAEKYLLKVQKERQKQEEKQ